MFKQQSILLLQSKGGHGTHLQKRTNTLPTHCVSSLRYRSRTVSLIIPSSISHQRPVSTSTVQRRLCNSAFKVQHPKGKSHLLDWPIVCLLWSKRPAEIETCIFFFMVCLASHWENPTVPKCVTQNVLFAYWSDVSAQVYRNRKNSNSWQTELSWHTSVF